MFLKRQIWWSGVRHGMCNYKTQWEEVILGCWKCSASWTSPFYRMLIKRERQRQRERRSSNLVSQMEKLETEVRPGEDHMARECFWGHPHPHICTRPCTDSHTPMPMPTNHHEIRGRGQDPGNGDFKRFSKMFVKCSGKKIFFFRFQANIKGKERKIITSSLPCLNYEMLKTITFHL